MTSDYKFDLEAQKNEINYDEVYKVINVKREESKNYLKTAIQQ